MRFEFLIILFSTLLLFRCISNGNPLDIVNDNSREMTDSLKWLYYAYTFRGTVVFKNEEKGFSPVNCEVNLDTVIQNGDSLFFLLSYFKDGVRANHIREGLNLRGFGYHSGVIKPLTGMLDIVGSDNGEYLKSVIHHTGSVFRRF